MGYRDDFYIAANIIGYTGRPYPNPTVYFRRQLADGRYEFGHITQAHPVKENVGREEVRTEIDYTIGNEVIDNKTICVERVDGYIRHKSRNAFVDTIANPPRALDQALINAAIRNFATVKPLANMSRVEQDRAFGVKYIGKDMVDDMVWDINNNDRMPVG